MNEIMGCMIVNGKRVQQSKSSMNVINPATEEILATIPTADEKTTQNAIGAAHNAFSSWAKNDARGRAGFLHSAAGLLRDRVKVISEVLTSEHGKPLKEAVGEVKSAADAIDYYAEEAKRIRGTNYWQNNNTVKSQTFYQPIGVVGIIAPYNYPLVLTACKLGPALAAGNTVVVKAPSATPLSVELMLECFVDSGLKNGEVNCLNGEGNEIGKWLVESPLLQKITFTGSTTTGKKIMSMAGKYVKKLTLELGGNSPILVFGDADVDKAAKDTVYRAFKNAGQVCNSINRVYVEKNIAQEFVHKVVADAIKMVIGNGIKDPDIDIGPMTTADGLSNVENHVKDALEKGAHLECGGKKPSKFSRGYFYEPTVLTNVNHEMKVMREETFGPVAPIMTFSGVEQGLNFANDTIYGLVAYLYTKDLAKALKVSEDLQYGTIGINNVSGGEIGYPYGGWKQSGIGIEFSEAALYEYLCIKHVRIKL